MMEQQRLRYVKVTNNADTPFVDMFDGIPVTIDPHDSQNIQPEQAFHFFGYTEDAKKEQMVLHTSKRRGWNTSAHLVKDDSGKTLAERLFEQLTIEPVVFKLVEEPLDADKPIPAEGSGEDGVEAAPPPPKFTPAKPQTKKPPARAGRRPDDDE